MYKFKEVTNHFLLKIGLVLVLGLSHSYGQSHRAVYFETDQCQLKNTEYNRLAVFFQTELKNAEFIYLSGHTDNDGNLDYNKNLSECRVKTVFNVLVELGYPKTKISTRFYGEERPLNENQTVNEKAINRRVEIEWTNLELDQVDSEEGRIQDLYAMIESESQHFCIWPDRDTMLYLKEGTIINIPANTFPKKSESCIRFNAKEFYTLGAMLIENLSTSSNGQMLETGGMVYTEAIDDEGNNLTINPGKSITIMMPTDTLRPDMLLFQGNRDYRDAMNWDLPNGQRIPLGHFNYRNCWQWDSLRPSCEPCRFFLCRVGRLGKSMKGMVDSVQRAENREFRECQRQLGPFRKRRLRRRLSSGALLPNCEEMMAQYGVNNYAALMDTIAKIEAARMKAEFDLYGVDNYKDYVIEIEKKNQELKAIRMQELGVTTEQEYQDTLRKIQQLKQLQEFDQKVDQLGNGSTLKDLKFYIANVNQLGWINCDAFSNLKGKELRTIKTSLPAKPYLDCKIIFKDRKSIMPPTELDGKFVFQNLPKDSPITFLALKFVQNQPYIYLVDGTTNDDFKKIDFEPVSKEELIKILSRLKF
ncbi:OmpA family protein [Crocinitomix algicola]|uniref:OmpA family protein n=1 Tax=Crocinitomix algicola TaxID=1740263 RepID=UPI00082BF34B|nr:OmpA family protein [Crocinitomix algicola]